jgi:hypothetical protein
MKEGALVYRCPGTSIFFRGVESVDAVLRPASFCEEEMLKSLRTKRDWRMRNWRDWKNWRGWKN